MRVPDFSIHEIVVSDEKVEGELGRTAAHIAPPALVDRDAKASDAMPSGTPITLITPDPLSPTSIYLAARFEFDDLEEANLRHNIGVMLTRPDGVTHHCHFWILAQDPVIPEDGDLPNDPTFRMECAEFPFTFVREGTSVITLSRFEMAPESKPPHNYTEFMSQFVDILATASVNVLASDSR